VTVVERGYPPTHFLFSITFDPPLLATRTMMGSNRMRRVIGCCLGALLALSSVKVAYAAGSDQTWDFGSGNSSSRATYRWQLSSIDDDSLKLTCLIHGSTRRRVCIFNEGVLAAPKGYKICSATIDMRSSGIPDPSTFTGVLQNQTHQLAWHAEFGDNGPQPLSARVHFVLVPDESADECMKDGAVYECGVGANNRQGCNEKQPGGIQR
jgi:hypothetical protein